MTTKPMISFYDDPKCHFLNLCDHLDTDKRVQVYRNLHTGTWSVRQGGIVKLHTDYICLKGVQYRVGQKGRERVIREQKKNVHAYVSGFICSTHEINGTDLKAKGVRYNPYKYSTFVNSDDEPIYNSKFVDMYAVVDTGSPVLAF